MTSKQIYIVLYCEPLIASVVHFMVCSQLQVYVSVTFRIITTNVSTSPSLYHIPTDLIKFSIVCRDEYTTVFDKYVYEANYHG